MTEAGVTDVQIPSNSWSRILGGVLNPVTLAGAFTSSSNLAWSIIYYNEDYWLHDSTPEATGKTITEATQKLVLFSVITQSTGKIGHLLLLMALFSDRNVFHNLR